MNTQQSQTSDESGDNLVFCVKQLQHIGYITMDKFTYMEFIEREIKDLDEETVIQFGKLVYQANPEYVTKCSDGSRILLNKLPEDQIKTLYNFVKNQIDIVSK